MQVFLETELPRFPLWEVASCRLQDKTSETNGEKMKIVKHEAVASQYLLQKLCFLHLNVGFTKNS